MALDSTPFAAHDARRQHLDIMLDRMKREPCKSPFDEMMIEFLEALLDYHDKAPVMI